MAYHRYISALQSTFRSTSDKHAAHMRCRPILLDMSGDPSVFRAALERHILQPGSLNVRYYARIQLDIELNAYYALVANCWMPLPGHETHVSTYSIHHHGTWLLTTVTSFGPGYEQWMFTRPEPLDHVQQLYAMEDRERSPHPLHHVAFVDAYEPHVPFRPPSLTVTFSLWCNQSPAKWKDHLRRLPGMRGMEDGLQRLAAKAGVAKIHGPKVVEPFDFYPAVDGFRGIKEPLELEIGPNDEYLYSLFHIIQQTGNEELVPLIEERLNGNEAIENPALVRSLIKDLRIGTPIEARLSGGHHGLPETNFTMQEVERTVAVIRHNRLSADDTAGGHRTV